MRLVPRVGAHRQVGGGGGLNAAGAGEELQFHPFLVRIIRNGLIGSLQVVGKALIHEVVNEGSGLRPCLPFQTVQHSFIVVIGNADGHAAHHHGQQQEYRQHRVDNPALAEAPHPHSLPHLIPFRHKAASPLIVSSRQNVRLCLIAYASACSRKSAAPLCGDSDNVPTILPSTRPTCSRNPRR